MKGFPSSTNNLFRMKNNSDFQKPTEALKILKVQWFTIE